MASRSRSSPARRTGAGWTGGGREGIAPADPATGRLARRLRGHPLGGEFLAFTPDGRSLLSAGRDAARRAGGEMAVAGSVRSWDVDRGGPRLHVPTGTEEVVATAVAPDGRRIAAGLTDRSVGIWDAESGAELRRFDGLGREAACLAFSPDGRTLAVGEGGPALWEPWDVPTVDLGGPVVPAEGEAADGNVGPAALGSDQILQVWNRTRSSDARVALRASVRVC
jgi:WD40 repeat protein